MPKKAKPKPTVVFCELRRPPEEIVNISSQNGAEGVVSRMLPKSHVSHVILNSNVSEERFLDMRVSTENKMKKKSMDVHDHFMNTFIKRLERKQQRWIKEDSYVSKNFQLAIASRPDAAPRDNLGALSLPTPPRPATQLLYKRARYPYFGVGRLPAKTSDLDFARRGTLPRIQTVPAGGKRAVVRHDEAGTVKLPVPTKVTTQPSQVDKGPESLVKQRTDSASTMATRVTSRPRKRVKVVNNYDNRFTELMSWLSPVDAMRSQLHAKAKAFQVAQSS